MRPHAGRVTRDPFGGILAPPADVNAQTSRTGIAALCRTMVKCLKRQDFRAPIKFTKAVARLESLCYTRADFGRAPLVHATGGL